MARMMSTPNLVENADGTFSPKKASSIRFRARIVEGLGQVELLLGEDVIIIHKGMMSEESALELLNAQLNRW
ncbi:hypothetical protein [Deinococcus humi]|uniref:Uncharacterized protein n=1 Tax=Deinococcus humi TaxID=662880 RepID=A0A7W8JUB6_9DEIO|nr:hypothetical protein [Deinococcus humi]MBB5362088.1 hypothetical protein [Deinococcus humi]